MRSRGRSLFWRLVAALLQAPVGEQAGGRARHRADHDRVSREGWMGTCWWTSGELVGELSVEDRQMERGWIAEFGRVMRTASGPGAIWPSAGPFFFFLCSPRQATQTLSLDSLLAPSIQPRDIVARWLSTALLGLSSPC